MNSKKPHDERQVYRTRTNESEDFAEEGKVTQFNGIRVVDESESGEFEEFEDFSELHSSSWTVNAASVARLSNGTILYEGHR